jgi:hypothetical protein
MALSSLLVLIGTIALIALLVIPSYISAANYGNKVENTLNAKIEDNENIYAQGTQAVMEIAQVPTMMKNDLLELVKAEIQGKYGKDGSQATVQFLRDRNIPIDASMYKAIQQQILAFRNKFEVAQREMLDQRNTYQIALGTVWQGMWLKFAGYPKIDLKKFTIVTTEKARATFETKRDSGINLGGLRPAQ